MSNDAPRITGSSPAGSDDDGSRNSSAVPDAALTAFAHELRNALGPVRTAAYLLRASTTDDAQARWALDLIDRQVQAITASIDEFADFARLRRGALALVSEPMDLATVLDDAASACAAALADKRQTLEWTRPATRIPVCGDRARLIQALGAVLRATSRAALAGSRIPVRVDRTGTEVAIAIDGPADPAIDAVASRSDPGSGVSVQTFAGVGLAFAQGIIALHGGALTAMGRSRFAMRLPLAD
jgi:signal transduction histidine kinase